MYSISCSRQDLIENTIVEFNNSDRDKNLKDMLEYVAHRVKNATIQKIQQLFNAMSVISIYLKIEDQWIRLRIEQFVDCSTRYIPQADGSCVLENTTRIYNLSKGTKIYMPLSFTRKDVEVVKLYLNPIQMKFRIWLTEANPSLIQTLEFTTTQENMMDDFIQAADRAGIKLNQKSLHVVPGDGMSIMIFSDSVVAIGQVTHD